MNIVSAHFKGFRTASRFPRMLILMYLLNLIPALVVALPFFDILDSNAGHSLAFGNLMKSLDLNVIHDIIKGSGEAFSTLLSQVKWIGILYLLINVFLVGGIYEITAKKKFSVSAFFGGCGRYFFRMFFIFILMLAMHIAVLSAFYFPISELYNYIFLPSYSEDTHYQILGGFAIIYFFIFIFLLIVSDYAKSYMVSNKSVNFIGAFFKAIAFVFRHFFKTTTLYLMLMVAPVGFFLLYFYIDGIVELEAKYMLFFTVAVQQIFILTRIMFRVWVLSAQYDLYVDESAKDALKKAQKKAQNIAAKSKTTNITDSSKSEKETTTTTKTTTVVTQTVAAAASIDDEATDDIVVEDTNESVGEDAVSDDGTTKKSDDLLDFG